MGKIPRISLELNFTPNTLGCYGLQNQSPNIAFNFSKVKAFFELKKWIFFLKWEKHLASFFVEPCLCLTVQLLSPCTLQQGS